jgi:hypothetical protein
MPGLSPRSHARDRDLSAKPKQACNADQGYLMMEKTALGSRSSSAAQTWPSQVMGAASPNGHPEENLRHRSHSLDISIGHCRHRDSKSIARAHHFLGSSNPRPRSSRQSIPIGHPLGNGLVQPIFRPPSRRPPSDCSPSVFSRDADLKMLCVM